MNFFPAVYERPRSDSREMGVLRHCWCCNCAEIFRHRKGCYSLCCFVSKRQRVKHRHLQTLCRPTNSSITSIPIPSQRKTHPIPIREMAPSRRHTEPARTPQDPLGGRRCKHRAPNASHHPPTHPQRPTSRGPTALGPRSTAPSPGPATRWRS